MTDNSRYVRQPFTAILNGLFEELSEEPEGRGGEHIGGYIAAESDVPFVTVSFIDQVLQMLLILLDCLQDLVVALVLHCHQNKESLLLVGHLIIDTFEEHPAGDGIVHFRPK